MRFGERPGLRPFLALIFLALVICSFLVTPAHAETLDIVVDSTDLTVKTKDGVQTAEVTLANLSSMTATILAGIPNDPGCTVDPSPTSISPGRRTTVTLTLGSGCALKEGADVSLTLGGGVRPPTLQLKAKALDSSVPAWDILPWSLLAGLIGSLAAEAWIGWRIWQLNSAATASDAIAARLTERKRVFKRREMAREARDLSLTSLGDEPSPYDDIVPTVGARTPLKGLGTSWSFKDAWVANVTVGSTALVAVLATADVLEAVLGDKPKAALALILVASAIATALVALGPLLLKAIGEEEGTATVAGTMIAAFVVLLGSVGQIATATLQASRLVSNEIQKGGLALIGIFVAVAVVIYGAKAIAGFIAKGTKPVPVPTPAEVTAAWIIAKAIRPDMVVRPLTPLDIDEILESDPGVQASDLAEVGFQAALPHPFQSVQQRSALL